MLRGVIFDFDGVLVDSERAHFQAFREVLSAHAGFEITFSEYVENYLAFDDFGGIRRALELHERAADSGLIGDLTLAKKEVYANLLTRVEFLPGAADLIRALALAEVPLAIASGSRRVEIETLLGGQGLLGCFRGIVSIDDVSNFKPHPEPYLRARHLIGAEGVTADVVAFEDSMPGMASARAANLRVIGVTNSHPREKLGLAHRVVDSLAELSVEDIQAEALGEA